VAGEAGVEDQLDALIVKELLKTFGDVRILPIRGSR